MYKKKVTLKDISLKASVSPTTVSIILNGRKDVHIGEETRQRVLDAASELGYIFTVSRKNSAAPLIAFVHANVAEMNIGTSFFVRVATHLRGLCESEGILVQESEFHGSDSFPAYQAILTSAPRMFVSFSEDFSRLHVSQQNEIPLFVLQGEREDLDSSAGRSLYLVDDPGVGSLAAGHLLERGYRSCGMVFPEIRSRCEMERSASFIQGFESGGGKVKTIQIPLDDHSGIERWFREWTGDDCDCFYFFSDSMALPGLRGLQVQGVRIPEDVAVMGTDNLYWGQFSFPSLTTMHLHEEQFAARIFSDIQSYLSGKPFYPGEIVIPVDVIRREST